MMRFHGSLVLLLLQMVGPGSPWAWGQGSWNPVAESGITNLEEVSLARDDQGMLHLTWRSMPTPGRPQFEHRTMDPEGKLSDDVETILDGWKSLSPPALEFAGDGSLLLWFGGIRGSDDPKDPYNRGSLYQLTKKTRGEDWELLPGARAQNSNAYVGPIGLTRDLDGEAWVGWAAGSNLVFQKGAGEEPTQRASEPGCCPYLPQLATDTATGEVVLGWYSNARPQQGILVRSIWPARGELAVVPDSFVVQGSTQASLQIDNQLAIRSRLGGPGIYVAYCAGYPSCESVRLWKFRDEAPIEVSKAPSARAVNISRAPEGRLWVFWLEGSHLVARRSNKAATHFGKEGRVGLPAGSSGYHVNGEGSPGPLDAFVNTGSRIHHTRILPPLEATIRPSSIFSEEGGEVVISVTDVGDPIESATVSFNGQSLQSDSAGNIRLMLPSGIPAGKLGMEVQKTNYIATRVEVSVKTRPPEQH